MNLGTGGGGVGAKTFAIKEKQAATFVVQSLEFQKNEHLKIKNTHLQAEEKLLLHMFM